MRAWVYILECVDRSYYVGSYRGYDPEVRVSEHNTGKYANAWTRRRLPVTLVWCAEFQQIKDAIAFEQQIKRWTRVKKEAVIDQEVVLPYEVSGPYSKTTLVAVPFGVIIPFKVAPVKVMLVAGLVVVVAGVGKAWMFRKRVISLTLFPNVIMSFLPSPSRSTTAVAFG